MVREFPYTFDEGAARVRHLIGYKNLEPALHMATELTRAYPGRAESHNLLNLLVCLTGRKGGAQYATRYLNAAKRCADYTDELGGDILRDQALGLIRFAGNDVDMLDMAERAICEARELHAGDPNRMACLVDVEGRLAYARQRYREAEKLHARANQQWTDMSDPDVVWIYNNYVHWLKAAVKVYGTRHEQAKTLSRYLRERRPARSKKRYREAIVIRVPWLGNMVHDALTRRR